MLNFVALAILAAPYRVQFPMPNLTVPSGLGVNIHFTKEQPGELAKIANAGFKWVRMDFSWGDIERTKGKYDFSAYDRLMTGLDANKLRPMFTLDCGNDLYGKDSPRTDADRQAFCHFAGASLDHFAHRGIVWEMWNEPNGNSWKPAPSADEYIALAKAVGEAVRAKSPDEWLVGPATDGFDWPYLQKCLDAGLLNYWDAVAVHPTRGTEPDKVGSDWQKLAGMIAAANHTNRTIKMLSSNWGYPTVYGPQDEDKQAQFALREYLNNLENGVPMSIYCDWRDSAADPKDPENHYGLATTSLAPKQAYNAFQSLASNLEGYRYIGREKTDPHVHVLKFLKGTDIKLVAWRTGAHSDEPVTVGATSEVLTGMPKIY